jgi:hypothetical protein
MDSAQPHTVYVHVCRILMYNVVRPTRSTNVNVKISMKNMPDTEVRWCFGGGVVDCTSHTSSLRLFNMSDTLR